MLFSIALILIVGFALSGILEKFKLPGILGMIIAGMILGPYMLNLISPNILDISNELSEIGLVIILMKAGLSINLSDLRKVGRPAILLSFVPATFEIIGATILAPIIFGVSHLEGAIIGAILGAVTPAVIVPKMLKILSEGYGKKKSIPQLIIVGASIDDIYVIVLFTSFLKMYKNGNFSLKSLSEVPISITMGLLIGVLSGLILVKIFKSIKVKYTVESLIILSTSFMFITLEEVLKPYIPMSGMLSVMALGVTILKIYPSIVDKLMTRFSELWIGAEIIMFVLIGASLNIKTLSGSGLKAVLLILLALVVRIVGVYLSLLKTNLNIKERIFSCVSAIPKSTVQAAIGGIPLAEGVKSGNLILTITVVSILLTAPLGALGIEATYKKLLSKE